MSSDPLRIFSFLSHLGKTLLKILGVQTEFGQIAFQLPPPPLKQTNALWDIFLPKMSKFFKTVILTLGMDILTITMVKYDSQMAF